MRCKQRMPDMHQQGSTSSAWLKHVLGMMHHNAAQQLEHSGSQ
jgi:hypothetical protein